MSKIYIFVENLNSGQKSKLFGCRHKNGVFFLTKLSLVLTVVALRLTCVVKWFHLRLTGERVTRMFSEFHLHSHLLIGQLAECRPTIHRPRTVSWSLLVEYIPPEKVTIQFSKGNFDFCLKFRFLPKIWIFAQNLDFCLKFRFLSEISFFFQNFDSCLKQNFFPEISILAQNFDFCLKFQFLSKISIFV